MVKKLVKPYYTVVFVSKLKEPTEGYSIAANKMMEMASSQPGFLGADSVRDDYGLGITVSYWKDLDSIHSWKENKEHMLVQEKSGQWYENYSIHIGLVN